MYKCLIVTREIQGWEKALDKYNFENLDPTVVNEPEDIQTNIAEAEIIMGIPFLASPYIDQAKNLKWFQSSFAGVDALTQPGMRRDYVLTNVKDTYGKPMAEYTFAYILGLKRKIVEHLSWQKENKWNQFEASVIESETIGIVGTGSIGSEIAKIAKAFGMKTVGLKNTPGEVEHFDKTYSSENKSEFFASHLDYLVSVLPATATTLDFYNADTFSQLTSSPLFINVGRGNNVNEDDLCKAIDSNQISGAVLDVFKQEPLPQKSKLWDQKNVWITPHTSGYVDIDGVHKICEENYSRYLNNEELLYQIDFDKGY